MIQFVVGILIICFAAGLGWFGKNLAQEGWKKWKRPEVANKINEVKAEDTAERQLRAYVSIGPLIVKEKFPKEISFVAKNTGQTPAYDLSSHLNFEKTGAEVGLPDGFGFPIREGFTFGRSVATLGSNGEIEFTFPVDLDDLTKVQNGKMGLFYYGHISYKDIFKKDHVSKLCYQYTGAKQGDVIVHEFRMCENHNDADWGEDSPSCYIGLSNEENGVSIYIMKKCTGMTNGRIGQICNGLTFSAVAKVYHRMSKAVAENRTLRKKVDRIISVLS